MKSNYKRLYPDQENLLSDPMEKQKKGIRADLFLREVETLIRENQQLQCTGWIKITGLDEDRMFLLVIVGDGILLVFVALRLLGIGI